MPDIRHDVAAIGNAIVDIIGRCDDEFLAAHGAPKGHMRLVEAETVAALYDDMGPAVEISGGSAANTAVGIASLGGSAAFIGKVADDEFGRIFAHDIHAAGVAFDTKPALAGAPTARSLILVTPDGQRTMNTFLGVSPRLNAQDIDKDLIESARVLYLEGYLFDRDAAKAAFHSAAGIANRAGREVAVTLSDGFCVDRHREAFLDLIRDEAAIVFANDSEIRSLYRTDDFDEASRRISADAQLAVLTRSAEGALVVSGSERLAVPAVPGVDVVDTTGAGDLFAAGFLFGYTHGMGLERSARLGCLAAAEVISHVGARPQQSLRDMAARAGLL